MSQESCGGWALPCQAMQWGGGGGVPVRHIGLRVGPGPRYWLLGGTGRIQARDAGPPRPVPEIQGRSRPWRSLMQRGRFLESGPEARCLYSQGRGTVTEGAAGSA